LASDKHITDNVSCCVRESAALLQLSASINHLNLHSRGPSDIDDNFLPPACLLLCDRLFDQSFQVMQAAVYMKQSAEHKGR